MPTLYMKQTVNIKISENTDYSDPIIDTVMSLPDSTKTLESGAGNADAYCELRLVRAETVATTIETGTYDTLDLFLVLNTDGTNEVDVTWTDGDANSNTQVIEPGMVFQIPDAAGNFDPTLTAQSADCECYVLLAGLRA